MMADTGFLFALANHNAVDSFYESAGNPHCIVSICPHPKSLSQEGRGERDFNPAPLLPFWEKGLGDEGRLSQNCPNYCNQRG